MSRGMIRGFVGALPVLLDPIEPDAGTWTLWILEEPSREWREGYKVWCDDELVGAVMLLGESWRFVQLACEPGMEDYPDRQSAIVALIESWLNWMQEKKHALYGED